MPRAPKRFRLGGREKERRLPFAPVPVRRLAQKAPAPKPGPFSPRHSTTQPLPPSRECLRSPQPKPLPRSPNGPPLDRHDSSPATPCHTQDDHLLWRITRAHSVSLEGGSWLGYFHRRILGQSHAADGVLHEHSLKVSQGTPPQSFLNAV